MIRKFYDFETGGSGGDNKLTPPELRIGNWISNGEKNYTVDVNILYDLATLEYYYIYPIPLTPEILLACGFEKEDECWNKDGVKLWHNGKGFYHINSELLIFIDTVHYFQNWFYFNTGEELEIKL